MSLSVKFDVCGTLSVRTSRSREHQTYRVLLLPHCLMTQSHSISPLFCGPPISLLCSASFFNLSVSSSDHVPWCPPGAVFPVAALNVDMVAVFGCTGCGGAGVGVGTGAGAGAGAGGFA